MQHNALHDLMRDDESIVTEANCVLARLWRFALYDLRLRPSTWEMLMKKYYDDFNDQLGKKAADNIKGNLPKGLAHSSVTFKAFCRGVTVLNFKDVQFNVHVQRNGEVKSTGIHIPTTYEDIGGTYLKVLWKQVLADHPEASDPKEWARLMTVYKERYQRDLKQDPSNISSNLSRALQNESIPWNVFYQGLTVLGFETLHVELRLKRSIGPDFVVSIELKSDQ